MSHPREGGQSLVESALVLPIIILLLFIAIDLGRAVYGYNTITNAARQGARVGAVNQRLSISTACDQLADDWSIRRCAAEAAVALGITPEGVSVAFDGCTDSSRKIGCVVQVTVAYDFEPITPVASVITMSASSEMPIERVYP
jgi:Flp pilus assembly protein TadG